MEFNFVILIILFLLPGYVSMLFINLFSFVPNKKSQVDQILQYFLYSLFNYIVILFIISLVLIFVNGVFMIGLIALISEIFRNIQISISILFILSLFVSPIIGTFLGKKYFGKGYPQRHFETGTRSLNFSSIYSYIDSISKKCWIKCRMNDDTIISGALKYLDKDEEKRSYVIGLVKVKIMRPQKKQKILDKNELFILNLKDVKYIRVINKSK